MRVFLAITLCFLLATSCRDKIICAAFQSTYILDDSTRLAFYSPAWRLDQASREKYWASASPLEGSESDSLAAGGVGNRMTPYYAHVEQYLEPIREVKRSKYGISRYEPMWLRNYHLKTAPMQNVLAPPKEKPDEPDSVDIGDFVATDFAADSVLADSLLFVEDDSLMGDSTAADPQDLVQEEEAPEEPQYLYRYDPNGQNNVEQEYYNKYFGYLLVAPKKQKEEAIPQSASDSTQVTPEVVPADSTQTSGEKGLLKGRFGNKNKAGDDSESKEDEETGGGR